MNQPFFFSFILTIEFLMRKKWKIIFRAKIICDYVKKKAFDANIENYMY